jgi:branched-chain amino acid transport system permease protein
MLTLRRKERIDRAIKKRSDSIYALSFPGDLAYVVVPRLVIVLGLLALPIALEPWPYWSRVMLSALLVALLGMAFDFLANYTGLVCLGGAFFYGTGAYAAALWSRLTDLPTLFSIPLATLSGAMVSTLLIAPCLRLRGIYFAVTTLLYPLLAVRLIEAADVLGGTEGLRALPGFGSSRTEAYGLVAAVLAALLFLRRYALEPRGLVLQAIRDNDQAVRAAGINIGHHRARAVFIAACLGAFAGAWYTHLYKSVGVSAFAPDLSILPIAVTVVGGPGTLIGPLVGSLLLVPLGELLRDFGSLRVAAYALVLVASVVLRSEGLFPYFARKYKQQERWVEL